MGRWSVLVGRLAGCGQASKDKKDSILLAAGGGLLDGVRALRRPLVACEGVCRRLLAAGGHEGTGQTTTSAWLFGV